MIPDINIKDYYLHFINKAIKDIDDYNKFLNIIKKSKIKIYDYIKDKKSIINACFNINLDNYEEWTSGNTSSNALYQRCLKILNNKNINNNREIIIQLSKYCRLLQYEIKYKELIELANEKKNLKFTEYRRYVTDYYNKVHKCVLEGNGYKFQYGLGTYCINYWKMDRERMKHKTRIDFAATNARKKELLAKGVKLYNDVEAAWYKARNIPYNAVDYRIYKEENYFYEFTFIKSEIFKSSNIEYKHTEYVANKYRGLSYIDMANRIKNIEDIYNLQVDIKYKLNILLYKDPSKYLNFIRNAEQCKYKRGAHNS